MRLLPHLCQPRRLPLRVCLGHGLSATLPENGHLLPPRFHYPPRQSPGRAGLLRWCAGPCWPVWPWWWLASPGGGLRRVGAALALPPPQRCPRRWWPLHRRPLRHPLHPHPQRNPCYRPRRWRRPPPRCRWCPQPLPRLPVLHRPPWPLHLRPFWPAGGLLPLRRRRASCARLSPVPPRCLQWRRARLNMRRPLWRRHPWPRQRLCLQVCVPMFRPSTGRPVSSGNARSLPTASMPPVWLCGCSSTSFTAERLPLRVPLACKAPNSL